VSAIEVKGAAQAHATKEVINALTNSSRIVIAPPTHSSRSIRSFKFPRCARSSNAVRDDVIAVSPIINGAALKGPRTDCSGVGSRRVVPRRRDFYAVSLYVGD